MKSIIKTVSLLTIIAAMPGAFAATSRASITTKASPRLPSIAGNVVSGTTTTTTTSSSSTAYYGNADCIEKYTDCIKGDDVCGSDMQECTTNVLFHGQMAKCLSVLYQCSSNGINALFGTSSIGSLSNVATTSTVDGVTEVTRYTYPTDGSVLGQLIIGAGISNTLTTEQCVRRYTNCLQRDEICGSDFELCTTPKAFKKQAMLCDSTLARCQNDGKKELFGSVANAAALNPQGDSRLKQMIEEGNALAALNAVKTCQKVTDNCLVNACTKNPLRCVEGIQLGTIYTADFVTGGSELAGATSSTQNLTDGYVDNYLETLTGSDIRKMLKAQCLETIGSNKYCHMTYREKAPSNKELADIDLQEDVFSLAYAARKDAVNTKIQEAVKKFDTKAKNACVETIKECTMRSCGGGLGSVCYEKSLTNNGVQVNGNRTYNDIQSGCAAIVNADANCLYAASASDDGYTYTYYDEGNTTFSKLFPEYTTGSNSDPIGAVAKLNSLLATSYNKAAIENMKKQCQNTALSCVKSMCGKDYVNCYRNRTDIIDGTYSTDATGLNRSMNKMGGVLDYNIVIGLCMNTVKSSSVCEEHLKVATANWLEDQDTASWGVDKYTTVRDAWRDANSTGASLSADDVVTGCKSGTELADDVSVMACSDRGEEACGYVDEDGCLYDQEVTMSRADYILTNGAETLFQTLLADVEKEAQAKYNAKLTKEQNICLSNNVGGIKGAGDTGSAFMWVKLKSNKVPKNYALQGLKSNQFVASNDLYGSFCRARITVQSDDKDIQNELRDNATAYFAVGDSFTCGSWISDATLRKISDKVGKRELCKQGYGKWNSTTGECDDTKLSTKENIAYAWGTVAPALLGGAVGVGLTESGLVGGLLNKANTKNDATTLNNKTKCKNNAAAAKSLAAGLTDTDTDFTAATNYLTNAKKACDTLTSESCSPVPTLTGKNGAEAKSLITSSADAYAALCDGAETKYDEKGTTTARWLVPTAASITAGGLGAGITASVIQMKKENIKNDAAQKWMDEVGEHIQCYLGGDELGSYGDVISIELD